MPNTISAGNGVVSVVMEGGGSASALRYRNEANAAQAAAEAARDIAVNASTDAATAAAAAQAARLLAEAAQAAAAASAAAAAADAASADADAATATAQAGIATTQATNAAASAAAAAAALVNVQNAETAALASIASALSTALTSISSAQSTAIAAVNAAAATFGSAANDIALVVDDHTSLRIIGTPTPITGSNGTGITRVYNQPMPKKGYIYAVSAFGINSGGAIKVKVTSLSGGTETVVSDTSVTIPAGLATTTLATPIPFAEGQYIGDYTGLTGTGSRVPQIVNGAPYFPYRSYAGDLTTSAATGSLVTNTAAQIHFKVRFEDGTEESYSLNGREQLGEAVFVGRDTTVVNTGTSLSDNTTARFNPLPVRVAGTLEEWSVGAGVAGPMRFLLAQTVGGSTVNVYYSFVADVVVGANTLSVAAGTLPKGIPVYENTIRGYACVSSASGGKITYTAGSSTVGTAGHEILVALSTGLTGNVTFTQGTASRRYEDRLKIRRPVSPKSIYFQDASVLIDEDFSEGTVPPNVTVAGTWTFSAGQALSGSVGLANALEVDRAPAWNQNYASCTFRFNGATDSVYVGLRPATGNYGTVVVINAGTNALTLYNAWTGGGTFPASIYQTPSWNATYPLTTGKDYQMELIRQNRTFIFRLTDLSLGITDSWTVDLATWTNAAALSTVGMMNGALCVGAVSGAIIVKKMVQECRVKNPRILFLSDSMGHSRANVSDAMFYKAAANCRGGGIVTHVDGTPANSIPILIAQQMDAHPSIEEVVIFYGMNNTSGTRANLQTQYPEGVRAAQDRGARVTVCTVPPQRTNTVMPYTYALSYPELNDDIRSIATTYGCDVVPLDRTHTVGGDGITRNDALFSTEGGLLDVHFNGSQTSADPNNGHFVGYRSLRIYQPRLGLPE